MVSAGSVHVIPGEMRRIEKEEVLDFCGVAKCALLWPFNFRYEADDEFCVLRVDVSLNLLDELQGRIIGRSVFGKGPGQIFAGQHHYQPAFEYQRVFSPIIAN